MRRREIIILCLFVGLLIAVNSMNLIRRERMRRGSTLIVEHRLTRLSINTVSASELQELPGIGPVLAERIVQYRNENGGFRALEELKDVKGIGAKLYAKICLYLEL